MTSRPGSGRIGRRGSDRWTLEVLRHAVDAVPAASADAALIDGHTAYSALLLPIQSAASADAALIDGHLASKTAVLRSRAAASADAALIDGHFRAETFAKMPKPAASADAALIDGHSKGNYRRIYATGAASADPALINRMHEITGSSSPTDCQHEPPHSRFPSRSATAA